MNPVIYYHPDGYDTGRPQLMGRHSAGESFLQALLAHGEPGPLAALVDTKAHGEDFQKRVGEADPSRQTRVMLPNQRRTIGDFGTLHLPGPNVDEEAWVRRWLGPRSYSITGVFHTTATARIMDTISRYLIAPVESWDAAICTSRAVRSMVDNVLDEMADYLTRRNGAVRFDSLQRPIIPLGVNGAAFSHDAAARSSWRAELGIPDDAVVALFVGRLSYHAKAHPYPMYLAMQEAAARSPAPLHLVLSGWFSNDGQEQAFRKGAADLCKSVKVHFVDGRQPRARRGIWSAADLFVFLTDNIQETFGLVPVEAMAAGLPVVASDWDGVRDTVVHGETGFLVPTLASPPGGNRQLAYNFHNGSLTFDRYIGGSCQAVAVDVGKAAEAIVALASDPALRTRMGEAGVARVGSEFDWSRVLHRYRELWAELAARRQTAPERVRPREGAPEAPHRADPSRIFEAYPTEFLSEDVEVVWTGRLEPAQAARLREAGAYTVVSGMLPPAETLTRLAEDLKANGRSRVGDVVERLFDENRIPAVNAILWLLKYDVIRRT